MGKELLVPALSVTEIAFVSKNPTMGFGGLFLLEINVVFIIISGVLYNCNYYAIATARLNLFLGLFLWLWFA